MNKPPATKIVRGRKSAKIKSNSPSYNSRYIDSSSPSSPIIYSPSFLFLPFSLSSTKSKIHKNEP
jgi:hypothetical protein